MTNLPVLDKPKFRDPCNQCGRCCREQACTVSVDLLKSEQAPCIALEFHNGKFECGVLRRPTKYIRLNWNTEDLEKADALLRPLISRLLDIGGGCGMEDDFSCEECGEPLAEGEVVRCSDCESEMGVPG